MKATNKPFSISDSDDRMREILQATDQAFGESDQIPNADRLTYDNGFYIDCTALFIDIRGSSKLTGVHTKPVLGKIYRAYISECVAVLNQDMNCGEIFIQGDCVGAVFHTTTKAHVDSVFLRAAQLNSLIAQLNWRLEQRSYSPLTCGIGIADGRALMIKAGYKGSGINEVVWMGNVVNEAAKLCHLGSRDGSKAIQVSTRVYEMLNEHNKKLLSPVYGFLLLDMPKNYEGNFIDPSMEKWREGKKAEAQALGLRLRGLNPPRLWL